MNFSQRSSHRRYSVALLALRTVEVLLAILFLAVAITLLCGNGLSRQAPSQDGYLSQYFECFDTSQVEKLDFAFKGMFRGSFTLGRAKFKGPVELIKSMVEPKIKAGLMTMGTYDPAKPSETDKLWLRHECETFAGGSLPSWFDFPFDQKMRMVTEEDQGSLGDHPRPPYKNVWYFDDKCNIVYILGSRK
jgi:hypothetical protein